jgi:hypothetical protein
MLIHDNQEAWIGGLILHAYEPAADSLASIFSFKATSKSLVHFFRPEFERSGAHYLYIHRYLELLATLHEHLPAHLPRFMVLVRKVRKQSEGCLIWPESTWRHMFTTALRLIAAGVYSLLAQCRTPTSPHGWVGDVAGRFVRSTSPSRSSLRHEASEQKRLTSSALDGYCGQEDKVRFTLPMAAQACPAPVAALLQHGWELVKLNGEEVNDPALTSVLAQLYCAIVAGAFIGVEVSGVIAVPANTSASAPLMRSRTVPGWIEAAESVVMKHVALACRLLSSTSADKAGGGRSRSGPAPDPANMVGVELSNLGPTAQRSSGVVRMDME